MNINEAYINENTKEKISKKIGQQQPQCKMYSKI